MEEIKPQATNACGNELLRISDLAKASGASLATIHYYLKEGLLSPVKKTARNMAYYSPESVEDIRFIKELQTKRYLPLSVIKMMFKSRREGQATEHIAGMGTLLDEAFGPVALEKAPRSLSFSELVSASGLPVSHLMRLEALGLLVPTTEGPHKKYDDIDLRVARIAKELDDFGFNSWDLRVYYEYIRAISNEAKAIHDKIHDSGLKDLPVDKLMSILNKLKALLAVRVYRQAAIEFHQ